MGNLATFLQHSFKAQCPPGWTCRPEARLLPSDIEQFLGYSPRADVLLEHGDSTRRVWIEFEVSRADPVANHAKFATAHLFQPQAPSDCFLAMVSAHVAPGRRNLAANTVLLMRRIGMSAFQTVLLPRVPGLEIKRLNHLTLSDIEHQGLLVKDEIERALAVSQPLARSGDDRIHLAGDLLEVMLNSLRWNQDVNRPDGAALWKRRTVTYFVFDPRTHQFAPSKFCAFTAVPDIGSRADGLPQISMTMPLYARLDESEVLFDGARAQRHLTRGLGMTARTPIEAPPIAQDFEKWMESHKAHIAIHPRGPIFLTPPQWFV